MLTKKAIRYKKLSSSEIQIISERLELIGTVNLSDTYTYTIFYLLTELNDEALFLCLSPNITSVSKEFFINNKQFK